MLPRKKRPRSSGSASNRPEGRQHGSRVSRVKQLCKLSHTISASEPVRAPTISRKFVPREGAASLSASSDRPLSYAHSQSVSPTVLSDRTNSQSVPTSDVLQSAARLTPGSTKPKPVDSGVDPVSPSRESAVVGSCVKPADSPSVGVDYCAKPVGSPTGSPTESPTVSPTVSSDPPSVPSGASEASELARAWCVPGRFGPEAYLPRKKCVDATNAITMAGTPCSRAARRDWYPACCKKHFIVLLANHASAREHATDLPGDARPQPPTSSPETAPHGPVLGHARFGAPLQWGATTRRAHRGRRVPGSPETTNLRRHQPPRSHRPRSSTHSQHAVPQNNA